ncbi:MAG: glutamate-5-semialdehyde dehydrogenase [Opitutales bacterium]|nr:glutamate-5-semialdehyde dehydrogenase [Opitutales bacterium]
METLTENCERIFAEAQKASRQLAQLDNRKIAGTLVAVADALDAGTTKILEANAHDCARMSPQNPKYDRLLLTRERLKAITDDLRRVAALPSPLGKTLAENTRPNGLHIVKISVPVGIIGVIYEARPNVTVDVFSLCFKSGNVCLLKGSHDAEASNVAFVRIIRETLQKEGLDPAVCALLPTEREATVLMLNAVGKVDLAIPRGSRALIDFVRDNARIPVIETGAGVCHLYFDRHGNAAMARELVFNAKTRRVSVCNALDCLIVHKDRLDDLPQICEKLESKNVTIFADGRALPALSGHYPATLLLPATEESFGMEFLDYKMSVRVVDSLEDALEHIARHGSKHSEAIVSDDPAAIEKFQKNVDASCVYANASTAFTDGGQFGFGAEIGISTQKLHARGPMGLDALTTYKYLIFGNGQTRP